VDEVVGASLRGRPLLARGVTLDGHSALHWGDARGVAPYKARLGLTLGQSRGAGALQIALFFDTYKGLA